MIRLLFSRRAGKSLCAALVCWMALISGLTLYCGNVHAQSSFLFWNYKVGVLDAPVFDAEGHRLSGTNYAALLYGGPTPDALSPARDQFYFNALEPALFTYAIDGLGGYFRGGGASVLGEVPGGMAWLQVRAWDLRLGPTYEDAMALGYGYGESPVFYARGGNPTLPQPTLPEPLIGLQSFSLRPVPEPSVWVLLALGGIAGSWGFLRQRPPGVRGRPSRLRRS
jgi:hypothetical protein